MLINRDTAFIRREFLFELKALILPLTEFWHTHRKHVIYISNTYLFAELNPKKIQSFS